MREEEDEKEEEEEEDKKEEEEGGNKSCKGNTRAGDGEERCAACCQLPSVCHLNMAARR